MYKLIIILSIITISFSDNLRYDKLFDYIMHKGLVIEEDITLKELYELNSNGSIYLRSGELNARLLDEKFATLIKKKTEINSPSNSKNS
jgi:hypothetical protein